MGNGGTLIVKIRQRVLVPKHVDVLEQKINFEHTGHVDANNLYISTMHYYMSPSIREDGKEEEEAF